MFGGSPEVLEWGTGRELLYQAINKSSRCRLTNFCSKDEMKGKAVGTSALSRFQVGQNFKSDNRNLAVQRYEEVSHVPERYGKY